jgi:hypothetical protein
LQIKFNQVKEELAKTQEELIKTKEALKKRGNGKWICFILL